MPIDVIKERIITATVKYPLIVADAFFQLRYVHDAATSLANSRAPPIIIIGIGAAGKIATSPAIEKYAAIAEIARAENNKRIAKTIFLNDYRVSYIVSKSYTICLDALELLFETVLLLHSNLLPLYLYING